MRSVNSKGTSQIIYEEKTKVLYLKLLRTIYCCLESEMLWYNFYVKSLKGMAFKLNPYDLYVANKLLMVNSARLYFILMIMKLITWILKLSMV